MVHNNKTINFLPQKTLPPRSTTLFAFRWNSFKLKSDEDGVCLTLVASRHVESSNTSSTLRPTCASLLEEFSDALVDDLPSGLSLKLKFISHWMLQFLTSLTIK